MHHHHKKHKKHTHTGVIIGEAASHSNKTTKNKIVYIPILRHAHKTPTPHPPADVRPPDCVGGTGNPVVGSPPGTMPVISMADVGLTVVMS